MISGSSREFHELSRITSNAILGHPKKHPRKARGKPAAKLVPYTQSFFENLNAQAERQPMFSQSSVFQKYLAKNNRKKPDNPVVRDVASSSSGGKKRKHG